LEAERERALNAEREKENLIAELEKAKQEKEKILAMNQEVEWERALIAEKEKADLKAELEKAR